MPICRWIPPLITLLAFGQEVSPFPQDSPRPWKPAWELTFRGDELSDPVESLESFRRSSVQLRLRWTWEGDGFRLVGGTRSALGSDGNQYNAPRWDQQPSNGTQVDVAHGDASWISDRTFATLSLGFQENGLLVSQAIWDRDLRFLGVGGMAGFRGTGSVFQELGVRGQAGRVRNILGGRVDVTAGQVILKLETGPWSWAGHAGRWNLSWDAGDERLRRLPGHDPLGRQRMTLNVAGASATWNTILPFEARWFGAKNVDTGETSEEVQVALGSRERIYWPQVSLTRQRLSSTGTLYAVNGDEWWFYRRARGHRLDLALPLPGGWTISLVRIQQRDDADSYEVARNMLVLIKRF
jgi:hypothetical protein